MTNIARSKEILRWEGVGGWKRNPKFRNKKTFLFFFFAMFYIQNRITNDSYKHVKYVPIKHKNVIHVKRREIQILQYSKRFIFFNAYSAQDFV
jgi:hypothetical protein